MEEWALPWREEFAVGHSSLDAEHRHLIDIINQICQIEGKEHAVQRVPNLLSNLYLSAVDHFRHENSVMRDVLAGGYLLSHSRLVESAALDHDTVNGHCAEHARALIDLEELIHDCAQSQPGRVLPGKFLKEWFIDHATKHDAHLRLLFGGGMNA